MNIANHSIEIECSQKHVPDIAQVIIHSILFYRSYGKFNYSQGSSFSIGSLGYDQVKCDLINFSYVRYTCPSLVQRINSRIQEFVDQLSENTQVAVLALEFYKQRSSNWPFNDSKMNWELWNIKFIMKSNSSSQSYAIKLEDDLREKMFDIIRIVNSDKSTTPPMPMRNKLDTIFDTSHQELQPYLHCISYKISENVAGLQTSSSGSMRYNQDKGSKTDLSRQSSIRKFLLGTLEL